MLSSNIVPNLWTLIIEILDPQLVGWHSAWAEATVWTPPKTRSPLIVSALTRNFMLTHLSLQWHTLMQTWTAAPYTLYVYSHSKGTPWHSLMSAILPLKHLKRLSPQLWSLPLDPGHSNTVRLMPSDTHSCCPFITTLRQLASYCIPLLDFSAQKLNYNVHDKEPSQFLKLSTWGHYLKGSGLPINVVTDHWICNTFQWPKSSHVTSHVGLKYLSGFNLIIHFHPGKLGTKPDALTNDGHLS